MSFILSLIAVTVLFLIPLVGVGVADQHWLFGVIVPYIAVVIFIIGVGYRMLKWSSSPVPFRIPTTCGQSQGLPWIKTNKLDNPCSLPAVIGRMFLEIFFFRSLFRNTKMEYYYRGPNIRYGSSKWLWLFSIIFHYSFFIVLVRHLRFFTEPVLTWVQTIEHIDTFFEMGLPLPGIDGLYVGLPLLAQSGIFLLIAATLLFLRRVIIAQVRYITIASDWFPLLLIIFIVQTGIVMRYILKVDVVTVKKLTMSLVVLKPMLPEDHINFMFYVHVFLVSFLFSYFPFSKLMHFVGIWFSPTRNLVNNSRKKRHINPWNPEVKFHTYDKYEDDFRKQMIEAGIPVEKEA